MTDAINILMSGLNYFAQLQKAAINCILILESFEVRSMLNLENVAKNRGMLFYDLDNI